MNNKIEPGIMAMVIKANNKENLGKIVNVIRFVGAGNYIDEWKATPIDDGWLIEGREIVNFSIFRGFTCDRYGFCQSEWLMPIRPSDEQTEQSKTLELQD